MDVTFYDAATLGPRSRTRRASVALLVPRWKIGLFWLGFPDLLVCLPVSVRFCEVCGKT